MMNPEMNLQQRTTYHNKLDELFSNEMLLIYIRVQNWN